MSDYWWMSSDSHLVEPPDLFTSRATAGLRAQMPFTTHVDGLETWVLDGRPIAPIPFAFRAGDRFLSIERRPPRVDFEHSVGEAGYLPGPWLRENQADGVFGGVIFPSIGCPLYQARQSEVLDEIHRIYNDWVADFVSYEPSRMKAIALLNIDDPRQAARRIEDLRARAFAGVMIPVELAEQGSYEDPKYEPVWSAAEAAGLPCHLHIATNRSFTGFEEIRRGPSGFVNLPDYWVRKSLTELIFGHVFARHPRLRIVTVEHEGGWIPAWLDRLDWHYRNNSRLASQRERFPDGYLPSDYFRQNARVSFSDDRVLIQCREIVGVERIMWGNDYPHGEGTFPRSQDILSSQLGEVPAAERRRMTSANTVDFYGFSMPPPKR
jgi:predicted TIM-barrel fold metal-dependent hydrolase